jgi:hypothetical protein
MKELSQATIKKLDSSKEGQELKKFMVSVIDSLDKVSDIPDDWSKEQKAIEVVARKRATEKLTEMLKPFIDYVEPQKEELPETY